MLNYLWLGLVALAAVIGAATGRLKEVTEGAFTMADTAVMKIALPLAGVMALWLGLMRLAERSGLVQQLARGLRPVMRRLFPDVPEDHPAMGSMLMNMAANMLGLSNAATPLGLRAMKDLETLNRHPGTATNAMCTFLAINTSSIQLLPTTAIAILAAQHSKDPTAIVGTALLATICSTIAGITAVKWMEGWRMFGTEPDIAAAAGTPRAAEGEAEPVLVAEPAPMPAWGRAAVVLLLAGFAALLVWIVAAPASYHAATTALHGKIFPTNVAAPAWENPAGQHIALRTIGTMSLLAVPFLLVFFPLYAMARGVKVYEEFVEGAKEGFQVAIRIIPFLVAILVAIGMFRGAGGIEALKSALAPLLTPIGFPPDLLPLVLVRPLSGSATTALFVEIVGRLGPDALITRMAGTIFGSTETTFYVIAVYFGSVAVRRTRHAVAAGLIADFAGVVASVIICRLMFG
ncbi:MAG: nucleoside recognition protein [Verrucomicrobia bacterium]|nr:nucleoside recognition protein [Verrucomicrobiota bacterium]